MTSLRKLHAVVPILALSLLTAGSCLADISSALGTGANATVLLTSPPNVTLMDGFDFPTSVVSDILLSTSSQVVFTYTPPPNYVTPGDRMILELFNGTGSTLSNFNFTLSGASGPQYYDAPLGSNPPYQGVPSAGVYNSTLNTYTTTADLSGYLNGGHTSLSGVAFTLAPGQEQDVYFAVNYVGAPDDFTLTLTAAPEPGLYGVLAAGLAGLVVVVRRRKAA